MTPDEPNLPRVSAYHGDKDGVRWGDLHYPNHGSRRYLYDRLHRIVGIWILASSATGEQSRPDLDQTRRLQALDALLDYELRL